jgi:hypothetical protein
LTRDRPFGDPDRLVIHVGGLPKVQV